MTDTTLPTTRDGDLSVTSSVWDHNGSFDVQIVDHRGFPSTLSTDRFNSVARARRLARKCDPMDQIQWTQLCRTTTVTENGRDCPVYHIRASRLSPTYR